MLVFVSLASFLKTVQPVHIGTCSECALQQLTFRARSRTKCVAVRKPIPGNRMAGYSDNRCSTVLVQLWAKKSSPSVLWRPPIQNEINPFCENFRDFYHVLKKNTNFRHHFDWHVSRFDPVKPTHRRPWGENEFFRDKKRKSSGLVFVAF